MRESFEDTESGGFFSTAEGDSSLVMRVKEDYDGAEPSGNSIAALNLLRLSRMTGNEELQRSAQRALDGFSSRIASGASGFPQMLAAVLYASTPPRQIVLAGELRALGPMMAEAGGRFLPFHAVLWSGSGALNAELLEMSDINGLPAAYVCENFTCQLPVTTAEDLGRLLQSSAESML
jgi:uncharacterized protein YyaL (SSP411 family)